MAEKALCKCRRQIGCCSIVRRLQALLAEPFEPCDAGFERRNLHQIGANARAAMHFAKIPGIMLSECEDAPALAADFAGMPKVANAYVDPLFERRVLVRAGRAEFFDLAKDKGI